MPRLKGRYIPIENKLSFSEPRRSVFLPYSVYFQAGFPDHSGMRRYWQGQTGHFPYLSSSIMLKTESNFSN
jgi:hypothetical protein